ncbi:unnamed protein product [Effrenium voratum]|nr:unnamed protein product [Effrenium voratum]
MTELLSGFVKDAFPELFVERQVIAAEQSFERRLAEYEMNIEQQKLFREDLRDLVELTVGRMDVYHLVGALLLEFCIHFYCENQMIEGASESKTKSFLVVFFLIANLSACGFLVFSVWLSMHASVASHSIGVRLLTSFARLSIPTRKELEEVARAPLVPMMERFRQLGKRLGLAEAQEGTAEQEEQRQLLRRETAQLARAAAGLSTEVESLAIQEGAKALSDREYHFRRFLKEQRRWLFYDAYARVCMALGINQMLQALSYYILGSIAEETPAGAALSLLGMQVLSLLLLRLDMAEGVQSWCGVFTVMIFMAFPPLYIGVLIHLHLSVRTVEFFALLAFALHSAWMLLIATYLVPENVDQGLPKTLRTVLYLDVLHLEQQEIAEDLASQQSKDSVEALLLSQQALQQAMRRVLEQEAAAGYVSSEQRHAQELAELEAQLKAEIAEARTLELTTPSSSTRSAVRSAEKVLEHLTVWQAAPEIHASLKALSKPAVKSWLSAEQKQEIELAYQSFLSRCRELDLGICSSAGNGSPAGRQGALSALEVASGEERDVRVDASGLMGAYGGYGEQSVFIDSEGHINHSQPSRPATSFDGAFSADLPSWNQSAMRLMREDSVAAQECQIAERPRLRRMMTRRERRMTRSNSGQPYVAADASRAQSLLQPQGGTSILPASAVPPHALPGVIVRRYTMLIGLLWIVSGITHGLRWTSAIHGLPPLALPEGTDLKVRWPKPAHLFEVGALRCNGSKVLVSNRFRELHGELAEGELRLTALDAREESPGWAAPEWRLWASQSLCRDCPVRLAAWTGDEIIIGQLADGIPQFRYALRSRSSCRATWPKASAVLGLGCKQHEANYTHVQALHLLKHGQILLVLQDDLLDAWDLQEAALLQRFEVPSAAAVCLLEDTREEQGTRLLLARHTPSSPTGPSLEVISLPALQTSCQESGDCRPAQESQLLVA